jgi:hypothetical protein
MSATINWQIQWMKASTQTINGFSEVVLECGWICTGTQANTATPPVTFTESVYSTCSFPEPAAGGSFTPYNQLTQDQVLGWCWANGVDKTATEAAVQSMLNNAINPPVVQPPLPWVKQA